MNSKSINLDHALQNRESGLNIRASAWHQLPKINYVLPRVVRMTHPHVELLNFTPNGLRMLALPCGRRYLIVYRYRFLNVTASLTEALVSVGNQGVTRDTIFSTLFRQERIIELPWYNCRLKSNFCQFFDDDQHVLLYMFKVDGRSIERRLLVLNYINGNIAEHTILTAMEGMDTNHFSTTSSTLAVWCTASSNVEIYDIKEDRLVERNIFRVANYEKLGNLLTVEGVLNAQIRNYYNNLPSTRKLPIMHHDYVNNVQTITFLNSDLLVLCTEWRPLQLVPRNSDICHNMPIKLLLVYSISAKEITEVRATCRHMLDLLLAPEGRASGLKLNLIVKCSTLDVDGGKTKFLGHKTISMAIEKYKTYNGIYYVHF